MSKSFQEQILEGIPKMLPGPPARDPTISRAPARPLTLTQEEKKSALKNALRYFDKSLHDKLALEFAKELKDYGRIYMYRFRPHYKMQARPIDEYPGKCVEAKAIMHMIQNNLDPDVAQHPYELITYGGNGTVFPNWAQYLLTMKCLAEMDETQVLHLYSGHPLGLFPAPLGGPKVVLTNGMMIPAFSTNEEYQRLAAVGVTSYGQMTAGSFMYIGSQGIVHGTFLTILGAITQLSETVEKYRGPRGGSVKLLFSTNPPKADSANLRALRRKNSELARTPMGDIFQQTCFGITFVSSGLGGMSAAQAKAAKIAGIVGVIAEINPVQAKKQLRLGWVDELTDDLEMIAKKIDRHRKNKTALALGYVGNVVDLWQFLVKKNIPIDLGSDQTSLHAPYLGGYYPYGLSFEAAQTMMKEDPEDFREEVHESLKRHVEAINTMSGRGMFFFDYGNSFLRMAEVAKTDIKIDGKFRYPSYVEDIMGPHYFDFGFGPFRWVCTSADPKDLKKTDAIAAEILKTQMEKAPPETKNQMAVNYNWIRDAEKNRLVIGSQARILYSNMEGRQRIALAFNKAIRDRVIASPIVLGRDHHDVSGTDSPYRETANIYDGSNLTADMAVHNFAGLGFQGASWISLHNGGGVGWGYATNGGFGLVLDGKKITDKKIGALFPWDVGNGLARRSWAGNSGARFAITEAQKNDDKIKVTLPEVAKDQVIESALKKAGL